MYEFMESPDRSLVVGTRVQVRNRFRSEWSSGFEVATATPHSCRVRRLSDSYVLPVDFDVVDLRPAEVR